MTGNEDASTHPEAMVHPARIIELDFRIANPFPTMRKPFGVLAEGLISKNSRGDRTPIELFVSGLNSLGRLGLLYGQISCDSLQ
jgi:hypothetical protein